MENTLQEKQTFLREQILEKGYHPQSFLEYLTSIKQGGQDINLWTLEELKEIVKTYRDIEDKSPTRTSKLPIQRPMTNQIEKDCKKYERFLDRNLMNIEATIEKPEIVTMGGFLGFGVTSVLWYSLKTPIVANEVRRSDTDFDWLRSTLIRFYPNRIVNRLLLQIPPLAKSKPILPQDTKALFKRGQMIKLFIENLSKCEPLINCKLTIAFLTWGDYPRFESFKKQMTIAMSPLTPTEFVTQSGKMQMEISTDKSNQIKQIGVYNTHVKAAYVEIRQTIKEVVKNFQDLTASVYRIGNSFATLQEKHSDFTAAVPELSDNVLNEMMIGLNNCIIEWGRTFNTKRKALQKHLSLLFKFTTDESEIIQKVLKKRSIIEQEYTKLRMQLYKKRQKLSQSNPILNQIEIPLSINQKIKVDRLQTDQLNSLNQLIPLSEFKAQSNMREMLGSLNVSCELEFKRLQPIVQQRFLQGFKNLGKALLESNKSQTEVVMRLINGSY